MPKIIGKHCAELCSLHIAGSLWVLRLSQITGECGAFPQQEGPLPSGLGSGPLLRLTPAPMESFMFHPQMKLMSKINIYEIIDFCKQETAWFFAGL